MTALEALLNLVDTPRDTALLRVLLADEYLKAGDTTNAIKHLRISIERHPDDAIAWKMLGNTQARARRTVDALESYRRGIAVAIAHGDMRAAKAIEFCARVIERQEARDMSAKRAVS